MPPMATKPGDRIMLEISSDQYTLLEEGDKGTVKFIDSMGTVHVKWDNGSTLGLIPSEDSWRILEEEN